MTHTNPERWLIEAGSLELMPYFLNLPKYSLTHWTAYRFRKSGHIHIPRNTANINVRVSYLPEAPMSPTQ